jgi:hypothetical protein
MEKNDVEYVLYVYYLDNRNNYQWEKLTCTSLLIVEQMMNRIPEQGFTFEVYNKEYENAVSVRRHIPYHRVLYIDYVLFKK